MGHGKNFAHFATDTNYLGISYKHEKHKFHLYTYMNTLDEYFECLLMASVWVPNTKICSNFKETLKSTIILTRLT